MADVRNLLSITFTGHFRSIRKKNWEIFNKIAFLAGHFGCLAFLDFRKSLSIAFLAISDRSAILDVRNSLPMAFLTISDP